MLEHQVNCQKGDGEPPTVSKDVAQTSSLGKMSANHLKYIASHVIPQQPMFLAAVLSALQQVCDLYSMFWFSAYKNEVSDHTEVVERIPVGKTPAHLCTDVTLPLQYISV
jgi:hypothetical protein